MRRDYFRFAYLHTVKQVLATAPVRRGNMGFTLLSMVQHRDILSYLVAVKSFTAFLPAERIVMVCDPTIAAADRILVKQHVPHIELLDAVDFADARLPRGGCWERLSAIAQVVGDTYVVQLDADTVTVGPLDEVANAIRAERGFVLGELPDTPARSLAAVRDYARQWEGPDAHIQAIAEMEMVNVGLPGDARYIRGCAGFTGFPRNGDMRDSLFDYATRMGNRIGPEWKRWGSEQVTSNYLVSNSNQTASLPFPKYGTPDCATAATAFYHFIGSMRFINRQYSQITRQALGLIQQSHG